MNRKTYTSAVKMGWFIATIIMVSCSGKLEEEPKSILSSKYFESAEGIRGGVIAAYSYFRYLYGNEGFMSLVCFGTDTYTHGRDGFAFDINNYTAGLNPGLSEIASKWEEIYVGINTCNGVIDLASEAGLPENEETRLVAEAKYLRAHFYFILAQLFGDVSLNLEFNTNPSTEDLRDPVEEVYMAIIDDLEEAILNLPDKPGQPGRAFKASALHLLAKVYLTRAGSEFSEADDYENAYQTASFLINNRSTYGCELLQDFGRVHAQGNEHNSEVLWTVEWNNDQSFNEQWAYDVNGNEKLKDNRSIFFFRPLYESVAGLKRSMEYGRPWLRFKPTEYLLDIAFAERINDSRYDKTFQTTWICNDESDLPEGLVLGVDTALWMPGYEVSQDIIDSKKYQIITPDNYTSEMWPSLTKYDDVGRSSIDDPSVRPYIVHKLSETYLIAGEAGWYSGHINEAIEYINTVRRRAAYRASNTIEQNETAAMAMEIDEAYLQSYGFINFILNERARELTGESMRWFDLVRTGKLVERVRLYNPDGGLNIQPFHVLRPIPQNQIDRCTNEYPQNEGY